MNMFTNSKKCSVSYFLCNLLHPTRTVSASFEIKATDAPAMSQKKPVNGLYGTSSRDA